MNSDGLHECSQITIAFDLIRIKPANRPILWQAQFFERSELVRTFLPPSRKRAKLGFGPIFYRSRHGRASITGRPLVARIPAPTIPAVRAAIEDAMLSGVVISVEKTEPNNSDQTLRTTKK